MSMTSQASRGRHDIQIRWLMSKIVWLCLNTIWRNMFAWKQARKMGGWMLDVGCGSHGQIADIVGRFNSVGVDIFRPNVETSKSIYDHGVVADARHLPFANSTFNFVTSIEMLEHLSKQDGDKALSELERVAKFLVVITTPIRDAAHHDYYGNPFEERKYVWSPDELRSKGYTLRGKGIRWFTGDRWWLSLPMFMRPLQYLVYIIGSLFSYFSLAIADSVVAWKEIPQNV